MEACLQRGQVERVRDGDVRSELDIRGGKRGFESIRLGGLHSDQRVAIEFQLKRLAVERACAAHLQRVSVGRVAGFSHRNSPFEGQFADAIGASSVPWVRCNCCITGMCSGAEAELFAARFSAVEKSQFARAGESLSTSMAGESIVTCGKIRWNRSSDFRLRVASNFFTLSMSREAAQAGLAMLRPSIDKFWIGSEQVHRYISRDLHRPAGCPRNFVNDQPAPKARGCERSAEDHEDNQNADGEGDPRHHPARIMPGGFRTPGGLVSIRSIASLATRGRSLGGNSPA